MVEPTSSEAVQSCKRSQEPGDDSYPCPDCADAAPILAAALDRAEARVAVLEKALRKLGRGYLACECGATFDCEAHGIIRTALKGKSSAPKV